MAKKLLSFLLILVLCFSFVIPAGMAEGTGGGGEAPVVLEPTAEPEPEAPRTPEPSPGPEAPEPTAPTTPEPEPGPEAPESGEGTPEEPEAPGEPEATPEPEAAPEELFLAAVALLPQDPEAVETVTEELEEQLRVVTEQLLMLFTEDHLAALAALAPEEQAALDPLHAAALLVLRLNARVAGLNAQAAQAVRDLIAALPAAEAMTVEHEAQVTEAVAAFEALTAGGKALLTEEETAALAALHALMTEMLAKAQAALVDGMIGLLPETSEITAENYEEYQAPAQEASDALLTLSDYERGFVLSAETLEDFLRGLEAAKNAAQVLAMLNPFLSSVAAPADALTFRDSPTSVDRALAVEAAYGELTDAERADPILTSSWAAFGPFLDLARDLDYIREHGKIIITKPSLILVEGEDADIPDYDWLGLAGTGLEPKYELVLEFPGPAHITRDGDKIHAVAETAEDEKILVYGGNAKALRELAVPITVTVAPPEPDLEHIGPEDIDTNAILDGDVYTFNRAYKPTGLYQYYQLMLLLSVGKQYCFPDALTSLGYGVEVSFTNKQLPSCLSIELMGFPYLLYDIRGDGALKNATYKTRLKFDITFPGPEGKKVTVLSKEFKIVVTDKVTQLAFKPVVINTFYESREGEFFEGDSRYPAVWITPSRKGPEPYMSVEVVDGDKAKYPVTIAYDAGRGQYKLVIHGGVKVEKTTTWKVRFLVDSDTLKDDRYYIITVPITFKRTAPPLSLSPKTLKLKNINGGFQVNLCSKKGYPISGLPIDAVRLPENSAKYPYQELFNQPDLISPGDYQRTYGISLKEGATGTLPSSFKLLVRVAFRDTDSVVDLPLIIAAPTGKVSLTPSSCALNWTESGMGSVACCAVRFTTGDHSSPALKLWDTTVNGMLLGASGCPLTITYDAGLRGVLVVRNAFTLPGKTYKVAFLFANGQTAKLTVSTKSVQNKIKLGATSFVTDELSPENALLTYCNQTYHFLGGIPAPYVLERKVGKKWEPAPSGLTLDLPESLRLRIQGISTLEPGKHTFRVYAPDQGIPAAKGTVFTVTVRKAALKFTATMASPYASVLDPAGGILTFTNLKLTGLLDADCLKKLDRVGSEPGPWTVTAGGAGAKYMTADEVNSGGVSLAWKDVGTYALRQNGLKPFKLTLQLRERASGKLLAESGSFTVKPVQNPTVVMSYPRAGYVDPNIKWAVLFPSLPYMRDKLHVEARTVFEGDHFREERVQWVTVKNAEKSNYQVYLTGYEEWGDIEDCAIVVISYKNAAAARKVKASETVTLLVMLESGVKPIEVKVPVKNLR